LAQKILGLDIGAHSIKGLLLEGSSRGAEVIGWESVPLEIPAPPAPVEGEAEAESGEEQAPEDPLVRALAELLGKFGPENKPDTVAVALPGASASSPLLRLPQQHVLYKSYYLLDGPVGRQRGPDFLEAIVGGKAVRVLLSSHDLLGALARAPEGGWTFSVHPDGEMQRELAIRFAVNLAMYVLCLDYKDDQVHAEELMRRRGRLR